MDSHNTIAIKKGQTSYSAYVPNLPGCVAVGEMIGEVKELIQEAIAFHLEGLKDGLSATSGKNPSDVCIAPEE
ncbi:hypothetical protein LEP3755_38540 [Leptolyngbya sp. NIES-3755]|nr:hypothetical protein LEP3755_38540 [Leptolyngbya sp. NIES-3755]